MTLDIKMAKPNLVEDWFGASFEDLSPEIRALHRCGGTLTGPVTVETGRGLAGLVGKRLAKRLGLPLTEGAAELTVSIHSDEQGLHWNRQFDQGRKFCSLFKPHGRFPDGYWSEHSGALSLYLKVAIRHGGWYWMHHKTKLGCLSLPSWFMPRTVAYKEVVDGKYHFSVCISMPVIGLILSYRGQLVCHLDASR